MDDSRKTGSQPKPFSFRHIPHLMINLFHRLRNGLQRFIEVMFAAVSSVNNFFLAIFATLFGAYEQVAMLIVFIVDWARNIFHYDYMGYFSWLITLPAKYYTKCKKEARESVWMPIANAFKRKRNRIERALKAKLRESADYLRGFCELLLASNYIPGGIYTVTAFLAVVAIIFSLKIPTVIRVLVQILRFAYSIVAFLLHPLLLTLRDVLSIFEPLLQIVLLLARIISQALLSSVRAIGFFVWLNLISIASGLFRCWQYFVNSRIVRLLSSLSVKAAYVLLEKLVFVFLPFMTQLSYYFGAGFVDVSSTAYKWLYPWFIRGFSEVSVNIDSVEYLTTSGIGSGVLIFWALLLAFRFRNRFSGTFYSEIDGKQYTIRSSTASNTDRYRRDSQRGREADNTTKYDYTRRRTTNGESSLRNRVKTTRTEEREPASDNSDEGQQNFNNW